MKLNHDQASPRFLMFYQAVASFLKPFGKKFTREANKLKNEKQQNMQEIDDNSEEMLFRFNLYPKI